MKRETLVFFLGLVILLMPFMGIPSAWKQLAYAGVGLVLILLGYQLRRAAYVRSIERDNGERATDAYVESSAPSGDDGDTIGSVTVRRAREKRV